MCTCFNGIVETKQGGMTVSRLFVSILARIPAENSYFGYLTVQAHLTFDLWGKYES
jgi:hypothetical protein